VGVFRPGQSFGGEREIRTLGAAINHTSAFQANALNHSAISPDKRYYSLKRDDTSVRVRESTTVKEQKVQSHEQQMEDFTHR
jgi:hypothetical protein